VCACVCVCVCVCMCVRVCMCACARARNMVATNVSFEKNPNRVRPVCTGIFGQKCPTNSLLKKSPTL